MANVWWGFSFAQTCPLGFQPVSFMKALMEVCLQFDEEIMALDHHSHQHPHAMSEGGYGRTVPLCQDFEINTTGHEKFHPSINKG